MFPHPLFAGCISLAFLLVGILFTAVTINVPGCWLVGIPSAMFFLGSYATAAAAITPSIKEPVTSSSDVQSDKPTFAILVLLVSIFSWQLEVLLHFLDTFCKNGPSPMEYFITLGIAISSTLYMQVYGKRIVREHFGAKYGTKLELSSRQAVYVTIFVVSFGIYIAVLRL
ncbi:MAG: hypothetical protein JNL58_00035 [Planctomyces sp.]|nr:hypothetical protein [Planctomyces sp.]